MLPAGAWHAILSCDGAAVRNHNALVLGWHPGTLKYTRNIYSLRSHINGIIEFFPRAFAGTPIVGL